MVLAQSDKSTFGNRYCAVPAFDLGSGIDSPPDLVHGHASFEFEAAIGCLYCLTKATDSHLGEAVSFHGCGSDPEHRVN